MMLDIMKYEAVAMLDLPREEREPLSLRAADLADGFAALDGIGTGSAKPLVSVLDISNVLREDICEKLVDRDEILANAPEKSDGYFLVPGTI